MFGVNHSNDSLAASPAELAFKAKKYSIFRTRQILVQVAIIISNRQFHVFAIQFVIFSLMVAIVTDVAEIYPGRSLQP